MTANLIIVTLLLVGFAVNAVPALTSPKSTFDGTPTSRIATGIKSSSLMTDITTNSPYSCTFSAHGWNAADWMFARRSDMNSLDEWSQKDTFIENKSESSESFTSMVYRHQWHGKFTVSATMAFTDRMAPSIVLAWKFGVDAQGQQEYLTHMEIVLFDQGINIWLHRTVDGKPVWVKTAYARFPLQKDTKHQLQVTRKDQQLLVTVDTHVFGYLENALPDDLYVGIAAAEGINRLYDFDIL